MRNFDPRDGYRFDRPQLAALAERATSGSLITDTVSKITERMNQRLEYEIVGAWRAGYDYLDVIKPRPGTAPIGSADLLRRIYIPSNTPREAMDYSHLRAHFDAPEIVVERYEICETPDAEIRARLDELIERKGAWP